MGDVEVQLGDETRVSIGDIVITRRNDRTLTTTAGSHGAAGGWVKNGDRWHVTDIRANGDLVVTRFDARRRRGAAVLPAEYVAQHVDLGYAVTAHRAQGITVDTSHVVVTPTSTRENLYVSMTRGRDANIAYVALDQPDDSHTTPESGDTTARTVLYGVLRHRGASTSAHQTIASEREIYLCPARLAAEAETIASDRHHDRYVQLFRGSGLTPEQHAAVIASPALGLLKASMRRAECAGHDLERLLPRIVTQHHLHDANDIAAILRARIDRAGLAATWGTSRINERGRVLQ